MVEDETPLDEVNIDDLEEDDWILKFFTWSRKILERVEFMEENGDDFIHISVYLSKCADLREKFLYPSDLSEIEIYYMDEMKPFWDYYEVHDPMDER